MSDLVPTPRTRLRRRPERGRFDRATLDAILDEGIVCHVSFEADGEPFAIPTVYARAGDCVVLHGSAVSRTLRALGGGARTCLCVTLVDGLVLARSAFHSSINYRSAILYGRASVVDDPAEKLECLRAIVEHATPGRWSDVRAPDEIELRRTSVLRLPIDEASAKVRSGGPVDDEADYARPCWAGEIPLRLVAQAPLPDPRLTPDIPTPKYVRSYRRPGAGG